MTAPRVGVINTPALGLYLEEHAWPRQWILQWDRWENAASICTLAASERLGWFAWAAWWERRLKNRDASDDIFEKLRMWNLHQNPEQNERKSFKKVKEISKSLDLQTLNCAVDSNISNKYLFFIYLTWELTGEFGCHTKGVIYRRFSCRCRVGLS